jgi:hypothetical protein
MEYDLMEPAVRRPMPLATKIGLGLVGISVLWWFFYYANYDGPFGLMGLKLMCISGATYECAAFQRMIHSPIPPYYPVLWYAGLVALIVGIYQNWKANEK